MGATTETVAEDVAEDVADARATTPAVADIHGRQGDVYSADCPCRGLLDVVANKWAALAIGALEGGALRFGELQRRLAGVSPKVLTSTLRRLEGAGLVDREVLPEVPLHVEYSLTPDGLSVLGPVAALRTWAEAHYELATRPTGGSRVQ